MTTRDAVVVYSKGPFSKIAMSLEGDELLTFDGRRDVDYEHANQEATVTRALKTILSGVDVEMTDKNGSWIASLRRTGQECPPRAGEEAKTENFDPYLEALTHDIFSAAKRYIRGTSK